MEFKIGQNTLSFYYEAKADTGLHKIADKVRHDIELVTGHMPDKRNTLSHATHPVVIFGTVDDSDVITELETSGKLDCSSIRNKWEVYTFQIVENPFPDIRQALVIAGSNKRGTIYGLFHLSECLGVSPLVDWSDVKPAHKDFIILTDKDCTISKEPSVKYRGIFINDEWPAFGTWCTTRFGGFNAKMYEHVFELILRLKGNYLWPAMWSACFSMDGPGLENARLADEMGIVIGSSHHEPCMRNGEEYKYLRGKDSIYGDAWDFRKNPAGIKKFWEDGLKRNAEFENIITLGMRGEQDTPILGENSSLQDNIDLLREVINTQNQLIQETIQKDLDKVPRVFVLFTEVEKFFYGDENTKGLMGDPALDGVTLMLSDDNFGNLRSVPTREMRNHPGGYGLYYHFDFHGGAYAYDWMNTNYLPKIWEQLTMAYDYGIRDIWIVNLGDICLLEYPASYFFDLAYDMERWGSSQPNCCSAYTRQWVEKQFSPAFSMEDREKIQLLLDGYTKINHNRKPEILNDSVYHPVHFGETERLLSKAAKLTSLADELRSRCPRWAEPAFYELVYFPVAASMNVLKMQLLAGRNRFYANQNRICANELADEITACIERDSYLTEEFHQINNQKWYGMGLSEHIGFTNWMDEGNRYPKRIYVEPANKPRIIVAKSDSSLYTEGYPWTGKTLVIRDFLRPDSEEVRLDIALGSKTPVNYQIETDCPWLRFSALEGCVTNMDTVTIRILRDKLHGQEKADVYVVTENARVHLLFEADTPDLSHLEPMTFLEYDGYICMEAEHYATKYDTELAGYHILNNYGRTLSGIKVLPSLHDFSHITDRPFVEYHFEAKQEGDYELELYLAPSNTPYMNHEYLLGIQCNESTVSIENLVSKTFRSLDCSCPEWVNAVRENIRIYHTRVSCRKGKNILRLYAISAGPVLEKIVLYPSGTLLPDSYLGPTESYFYHRDEKLPN